MCYSQPLAVFVTQLQAGSCLAPLTNPFPSLMHRQSILVKIVVYFYFACCLPA